MKKGKSVATNSIQRRKEMEISGENCTHKVSNRRAVRDH